MGNELAHEYGYPTIREVPVKKDAYCLLGLQKDATHIKLINPRIYFNSGKMYKDNETYRDYPKEVDYNDVKPNRWCVGPDALIWNPFRCSSGVITYDINSSKEKTTKKLQVMWYCAGKHEWDVNWFALGLGEETASEALFKKMFSGE